MIDQTAGDGVFSYTYTIPKTASPGTYDITVKVTSTIGEPSLGYLTLKITQATTDGGDGGDGTDGDGGDGTDSDGGDFVPPTAKDDEESSKKKQSTPGFHAVDLLLVAGVLALLILIARRRWK